ncbi:MAG: type II secretion system protein [Pirellulales bacterium]
MKCARRAAFTLIEVLIVVVIMAILAGAIIPHMSDTNKDAKEALLRDHLRTMRAQIELYKVHHFGTPPGNARTQLTGATDAYGNISPTGLADANYPYGPYLKDVPAQPFSGSTNMRLVTGTNTPTPVNSPGVGWIYQATTGRLWVDHSGYFSY